MSDALVTSYFNELEKIAETGGHADVFAALDKLANEADAETEHTDDYAPTRCPKCKTPCTRDDVKCKKCGTKLRSDDQREDAAQLQAEAESPGQHEAPPGHEKTAKTGDAPDKQKRKGPNPILNLRKGKKSKRIRARLASCAE